MYLTAPHCLKPNMTLIQHGDTDLVSIDSLYNTSFLILYNKNEILDKMRPFLDFGLLELTHEQFDLKDDPTVADKPCLFTTENSGNYMWRSSWEQDADY